MSTDFHTLTIRRIDAPTDDSVAITFDVPEELREQFRHQPGQHLVLKADIGGDEVRRSYSICSPVGADPRIAVKRIPNGVFSAWATTSLAPGDTLDVMAPIGEFTLVPAADGPKRRVAIAAGSGITPVLSMITTALTDEPESEFTLVYGNRTSQTIMFLDEIEGLKNRFPQRFSVVHVLSREPHDVPLFQGRIDGAKVQALLDSLLPADAVDDWYLCGPLDLVETVKAKLEGAGVSDERIHYELFFDQRIEALPEHAPDETGLAEVAVTLDGRTSVVMVDPAGPSLLDYARSVRADVPFACKGGMCATCKARVVRGRVTMAKNYALSESQLTDGFVLTCQSHPVDDQPVELDFDAR
ncbi:MAG: phenylacetate-CoA oxygenase/reductase subunit PaaK [Actinomycetota bacterium]|nr:phenylacetate-CoA oxygenase/reductase subunit PaaK [Actinomycetota bacterium]